MKKFIFILSIFYFTSCGVAMQTTTTNVAEEPVVPTMEEFNDSLSNVLSNIKTFEDADYEYRMAKEDREFLKRYPEKWGIRHNKWYYTEEQVEYACQELCFKKQIMKENKIAEEENQLIALAMAERERVAIAKREQAKRDSIAREAQRKIREIELKQAKERERREAIARAKRAKEREKEEARKRADAFLQKAKEEAEYQNWLNNTPEGRAYKKRFKKRKETISVNSYGVVSYSVTF